MKNSYDKADDPLYLPMIQRLRETFLDTGLLYLGDSKMSAKAIRAEIAYGGDFYLVPLAKVGDVADQYDRLVDDMVDGTHNATLIYAIDDTAQLTQLVAAGYETTRTQQMLLPTGQTYAWTERILVIRSLDAAKKQFAALEHRLAAATKALWALTPQPGRGRRQIRSQSELKQKADAILAEYDVADYLSYQYQRRYQVKTKYIGPGRGSATRKKRQRRTVRYQITGVMRDEAAITKAFACMGFKVYATNQPKTDLPLDEAVRLYRAAPRIERHFHLFKSAPITTFSVRGKGQSSHAVLQTVWTSI